MIKNTRKLWKIYEKIFWDYISDKWNPCGYQGVPKLTYGSIGGGPVGSLGAKALPSNHSVLQLCTNTLWLEGRGFAPNDLTGPPPREPKGSLGIPWYPRWLRSSKMCAPEMIYLALLSWGWKINKIPLWIKQIEGEQK